MPFTIFHGLIPYFLASTFTENKKLRILAFIAGMLPDLDGTPVLFDRELYYQIHHELFHAPIYGALLGIPVALILEKYFGMEKKKSFLVFAVSFALHPITDVFFTNWPVKLLWPFSQEQFSNPLFMNYNVLLAATLSTLLLVQIVFYMKKKLFFQKKRAEKT